MLERVNDLRYDVKIICLDMLVPAGHLLQKIEHVFADAKEKHGMRYTLHRGLTE